MVDWKIGHNERCSECKNVIFDMLRKIHGVVKFEYNLNIPAKIEAYQNSEYYLNLKEILSDLEQLRWNKDFIRTIKLSNCDFFVVNPGFIVELDEPQHFTACRKIILSKYPEDFELGFDRQKWIKLCKKINARDDSPAYRDEQRAWYDTLRDFIPAIKGFKPTVRLFMNGFRWCSLNPENLNDVEKFKRMIGW